MAQSLGEAVIEIGADASKFRTSIKKELDKAEEPAEKQGQEAGKKYASGFDKGSSDRLARIKQLAVTGAIAIAGAGAAAGGFGLKIAADMEQAQIAFETMLGSGEKAASFLEDLKAFAAKTPFEFPELQTAASSLVSAGIEASKVIPIMTTLGNATSGMGTGSEGVQRATVALQQMAAAGRITGEDLNQLRDAGIPVFDLLAAATGKSKEEVAALAQAGKLGKQELEQLMSALESGKGLERFNGLMEKQSASLIGLFSTMKDIVGQNLAGMMEPLIPSIKNAMDKALPVMETGMSRMKDTLNLLVTGQFDEGMFGGAIAKDSEYVNTLYRIRDGVGFVKDSVALLFTGDFKGGFGGKVEEDSPYIDLLLTIRETFQSLWASISNIFSSAASVAGNLGPLLGLAFGSTLSILSLLAPAIETVTKFLADNEGVTMTLVGAMLAWKGVALVNAGIAAFQASTLGVWTASQLAAGSATTLWSKAQLLLNASFKGFPLVWILTAVAALVAAFVWAWNNIDGFKQFWLDAWDVIKTAAVAVWENFLKPTWDAIVAGFGYLVDFLAAAWTSVLKPAWDAIASAALSLWQGFLQPVFAAIWQAWGVMADFIMTLWRSVLAPLFELFGTVVGALWKFAIGPVFDAIKLGWSLLSAAFELYWKSVLKPLFDLFGSVIGLLWNGVISPIFSLIGTAWKGLSDGFAAVWNNFLKPIFDAFGSVVTSVKDGFSAAVTSIGQIWDGLKASLKAPVQWVVDFVWNDGLRALWNKISSIWGGDPIDPYVLPFAKGGIWGGPNRAYASGGILPGYSPGKDIHRFFSRTGGILDLSGGEAILRPEATRVFGKDFIDGINQAAAGGGIGGVIRWLTSGRGSLTGDFAAGDPPNPRAAPRQAFAKGGIIKMPDWLSWIPGMGFIEDILNVINGGGEGGGGWGEAIWGMIKKVVSSAWDAVSELIFGADVDTNIGSGIAAGAGYSQALGWAKQQAGKPYIWGGVGPAGFDCSGFMSAITNVIRGRPPHSRIGATANFPWSGFQVGKMSAFTIGSSKNTGSGIGHMAGTLLGVNVESRGGDGVVVGSSARGFQSGMFPVKAGLFDSGGILDPGSIALNLSGRPEAVLSPEQTEAFQRLASGTGGTSFGDVHVTVSMDDLRQLKTLEDFLALIARARLTQRQTERSGAVTA